MNEKKRQQERWVFRMAECEGPFFLLALGKAYEIHHVYDISSSGMAIDMPSAFPAGEKIIITYETKDTMLSVKGEVRWCKEGTEGAYRFGIEFGKNNQKNKSLLLSSLESYRAPFSNNIFDEKRHHERKKFRTAVCEGPLFLLALGKVYEVSVIFDISSGGISLEMPKAFDAGDEVMMVYETKDLLHQIKGSVAWCAKNSDNDSYRFGVVFSSDDEKRKNLLLFSLKAYYESVSEKEEGNAVEKRIDKRKEYFFSDCKHGFILKFNHEDYHINSVRNVSMTGMEIEMPSHSFSVGSEVEIIHVAEKKIVVHASIIWIQCLLDANYCRFGIKFSEDSFSENNTLFIALKNSLDATNTSPFKIDHIVD